MGTNTSDWASRCAIGRIVTADGPVATAARASDPSLTISVVSHGHGPLLADLLDDLVALRRPGIDIVVTLNISETAGFRRDRWAGIDWRDNPAPRGFGANHNSALIGRRTDWYAIVNPDIRIDRAALNALLARAESDTTIALVAPIVVDRDGVLQDSARPLLTFSEFAGRLFRRLRERRTAVPVAAAASIDWLAGMFLLVRRDAFEQVRGFDEAFFLYCEDMDLSIRLQLAGHRIVYDRAVSIVHDAQRSSHSSAQHVRWHIGSVLKAWRSPAFRAYRRQRRSAERAG